MVVSTRKRGNDSRGAWTLEITGRETKRARVPCDIDCADGRRGPCVYTTSGMEWRWREEGEDRGGWSMASSPLLSPPPPPSRNKDAKPGAAVTSRTWRVSRRIVMNAIAGMAVLDKAWQRSMPRKRSRGRFVPRGARTGDHGIRLGGKRGGAERNQGGAKGREGYYFPSENKVKYVRTIRKARCFGNIARG